VKNNLNEILDNNKKPTDPNIRPKTFSDYMGQENIKKNIMLFINSAKKRKASLDHMLFYGPPGTGKTTIAGIIAEEMGARIHITTGPAIERPCDIAAILTSLDDKDILFIDEIHRINRQVEELLYPAMEDYAIDIMIGQKSSTKSVRLDLPKFTLIGATTRPGMLSSPLRDRFGSINRLELYKPEELAKIVMRDAAILEVNINEDAALEVGKRSRGTPRIAIRILKRLRDFVTANDKKEIDMGTAIQAFNDFGIDENGLDYTDVRIIRAIHENFNNGPVGLETLASFTGEDPATIEDVYEPFLMQSGFISKTSRGRILNKPGIRYAEKLQKNHVC